MRVRIADEHSENLGREGEVIRYFEEVECGMGCCYTPPTWWVQFSDDPEDWDVFWGKDAVEVISPF